MVNTPSFYGRLESTICRDDAGRGLCNPPIPLCPGDLQNAAQSLARCPDLAVAITTGFFIPHATPPAAETDGITGALFLAHAISESGGDFRILSDHHALSPIRIGLNYLGLPSENIHEIPFLDQTGTSPHNADSQQAAFQTDWSHTFLNQDFGQRMTHLVAVERVGPSHTPVSVEKQLPGNTDALTKFLSLVPHKDQNQCHNMKGHNITEHTAPAHVLFESAQQQPRSVTTIGIGDGGNEIGMGKIPWQELSERISGENVARIVCRIATDFLIVAGTSNWGAYALGMGLLAECSKFQSLHSWDGNYDQKLLETVVCDGPAVDGVTGLQQATVDSLPFNSYFAPIESLRKQTLALNA